LESTRRKEYDAFVAAEHEEERSRLDAKFQEDLEKVGRKAAEELRQLDERNAELQRRQEESEAKHRMELEQQKTATDIEIQRQKEFSQAMSAAHEKSRQDQARIVEQLTAQHREFERQLRDQFAAERKSHDSQISALQNQITQLQNRSTGGGRRHRRCSVF
jgi:hypothetical protein